MTFTCPAGLLQSSRLRRRLASPLIGLAHFFLTGVCPAMGLLVEPSQAQCGVPAAPDSAPPTAALQRLPQSQAVRGQKDIVWAGLGSPTARYPHAALGSPVHAGSLHAMVATASGGLQELVWQLPAQRVFEDRLPRLVDLDGDGRDEIIVVDADVLLGAALVVFGLRAASPVADSSGSAARRALVEIARSPHVGSAFRWLNPVGAADFDGDGHLDIASVTTPHIGGVLKLYHLRPPRLEPYAQAMDVSMHRFGEVEQQLAVIVQQPGARPTIIAPGMQYRSLQALRWNAPGQWPALAEPRPLPARVKRMTPITGVGCLLLADASWWRVTLLP